MCLSVGEETQLLDYDVQGGRTLIPRLFADTCVSVCPVPPVEVDWITTGLSVSVDPFPAELTGI